jgi:EAL domain-containing protein (putative c-di-GMP-specific phosphodiesterase class I)
LEITESLLVDDLRSAADRLRQLDRRGVHVSIDDFGTGYSSLSYLQRLPVDTLKIDRTFVSQLGRQAESQEIVSAIITLARNLGMGVAAEGVETAEQAQGLKAMNCEFGQGFFYYRPLESLAVEALFSN